MVPDAFRSVSSGGNIVHRTNISPLLSCVDGELHCIALHCTHTYTRIHAAPKDIDIKRMNKRTSERERTRKKSRLYITNLAGDKF